MISRLTLELPNASFKFPESHTVTFPHPGPPTLVRVRSRRYAGKKQVRSSECASGPVEIEATPRPAHVELRGAPRDAALTCLRGCGEGIDGRNYLIDGLPPLPPGKKFRREIRIRLRHPDYLPYEATFLLAPGDNQFVVKMQPRCP